ncbi:MAG: DUF3014 domain-containing protein [Woeseiaceae bacterium]|nr:DUF3014 domain-containing protein [Woeseiaceae bacterium]
MEDRNNRLLAVLAVVVIGIVGLMYWGGFFSTPPPEPVVELPPPEDPEPRPEGTPRYPMPEPEPATTEQIELVSLPALDDSDAYFLLEVTAKFGPTIEALLVREAVIDKLVATIDNLDRQQLPEQVRPVGRLKDQFSGDLGRDDELILGISSYYRYDALIATVYYADLDAVYDMYRRFYPLFQKSYERLGYPNSYFNDRLVQIIDHLIATPRLTQSIALKRPNVLYEFADPNLEALSSGQKLMLRMGPDNAATLKRMLEKFRAKLVGE